MIYNYIRVKTLITLDFIAKSAKERIMNSKFLHVLFRTVNLRQDVRDALSEYFDKYLTSEMTVYDIGCGPNPFSKKLKEKVKKHVGVDIENGFYEKGFIDLVGSAYNVPVEDGEADAVISSQVIEHLDKPLKAIEESARILKKDGLFLCSFPFLYPLHAEPHDYTRFTEHYMDKVLEENGLSIIETKKVGGFWYILGMYFGIYMQTFDRGILKKIKVIQLLSWFIKWICLQIQRLETFVLDILDKDPKAFSNQWTVNYIIVAKKN